MGTRVTTTSEGVHPSNLTAGAAHDLRNVLFVVSANCEHLLTLLDPGDPRLEVVQAIRDAAEKGVSLARQMLSDAADAGPRLVDVNEVIRGVQPLAARLAGDRVALATSLVAEPWLVAANAVQIEQIVMNLVVNARDAMPQGGHVVIATENRSTTAAEPGLASQFVVISVSDTGVGIEPAVQERMFEPFFTTRKSSGGTGVGLATVRAIALLNGGHVEVSSAPGKGTTLRVVLPRATAGVPYAGDAASRAEGKRILLVENERPIREYLHRCLSAEGYDVQVASSGTEALQACCPGVRPIDLVVTDVHLPDIDGPDVARRLRDHWPDVGVVFMSGGLDVLDQLSDRGRAPVLAKPFTTTELVDVVRHVLAARAA